MMWTGDTESTTYNWVQPFVKFGVTAATASAAAVVAMKVFPQIENPLFIVSGGSLSGIYWIEAGEQLAHRDDPVSTRLHHLGLIPIVRGLQVACLAALAAPPLLNPGQWGSAGPIVRVITIYNLFDWTIAPLQQPYKHPTAMGGTTCWRAFMGCRGDYSIKDPHTCLLDQPSDRGR
jgi:hypothetical protein